MNERDWHIDLCYETAWCPNNALLEKLHHLTGWLIINIYNEAINRRDPFFAFEIANGRDRFVFMMFFSEKDINSRDRLFLYLRNTNTFLEFKAYGSYRRSVFNIYFKNSDIRFIIAELKLGGENGNPFNLDNFLEQINNDITQEIAIQERLDVLRNTPIPQNNQIKQF